MPLEINGDLQRSEVFRSQDDVLTAGGDVRAEGQDRSPPRVLPSMHWMGDADARDEAP